MASTRAERCSDQMAATTSPRANDGRSSAFLRSLTGSRNACCRSDRAISTWVRVRERWQRLSRVRGRPFGQGRQHDRGGRSRRPGTATSIGHGSGVEPARPDLGVKRPHLGRQRVPFPRVRYRRDRPRIRASWWDPCARLRSRPLSEVPPAARTEARSEGRPLLRRRGPRDRVRLLQR